METSASADIVAVEEKTMKLQHVAVSTLSDITSVMSLYEAWRYERRIVQQLIDFSGFYSVYSTHTNPFTSSAPPKCALISDP